jgi:serine/threonine-protein kinase
LAALAGDFEEASQRARDWEEAVAGSPNEWAHYSPRSYRMRIALETGEMHVAADLARDFLARRGGWMGHHRLWSTSIYAWNVLYRAGAIDAATLAGERKKWIASPRGLGRTEAADRMGIMWPPAYGEAAMTKADALAAIAGLREFGPQQIDVNVTTDDKLALGEVYRLAGDLDRALEILEPLTHWCIALKRPFHTIWARFSLGQTYEARGERDRACAAYESVLSAWRNARPRSTTADAARAKVAALACGRATSR